MSQSKQEHVMQTLSVADLALVLDNFPLVIWIKDLESKFVYCNQKFVEYFRLKSVREILGKTDFDIVPEFAEGYIKDDQEVMRTGRSKIVAELIKHGDGGTYKVETFKAPLKVGGKLLGTIGFARDMTDLKHLQEEVAKTQQDYTTLVQSLPMTIVRYDKACRRTFVSPYELGAYRLASSLELGKSPAEQWSQDIHNITGAEFADLIMEAMQTKAQRSAEIIVENEKIRYINQAKIVPELNSANEVIGALAIINDISEIAEYRGQIEFLAYHDSLTGADNRILFAQKMSDALQAANTNRSKLAVMVLDLDQFKAINDSMGHAVGDILLVHVAERINENLNQDQELARLGGDEFGVLIKGYESEIDLHKLAKRILADLAKPFHIQDSDYFVSASIGVACYPEHGNDIGDLIKHADSAMYSAKSAGGNTCQFYTQAMTQDIKRTFSIRTALQKALSHEELFLEYQPIIDTHTNRMVGVESLCRWQSAELGLLSPAEFIPVAEQTHLIVHIGDWVLKQAMQAAVQLNQGQKSAYPVAINISPRQFLEPNFVGNITALLRETRCLAAWIKLEVTETLLLRDEAKVRDAMVSLKQMGIEIAIDDFGTGYSALAYLNKFPIQQVKIDRSFIHEITSKHSSALLVKAILAMAISLGKDIVAEGVETLQQLNLLKELGCRQVQGYYLAKPMQLADLLRFHAKNK